MKLTNLQLDVLAGQLIRSSNTHPCPYRLSFVQLVQAVKELEGDPFIHHDDFAALWRLVRHLLYKWLEPVYADEMTEQELRETAYALHARLNREVKI